MNATEFYPLFLKSSGVVIDNRKLQKDNIFFAFSGDNFNAALFAESAVKEGALAVIVEDKKFENPDKNIFCVSSTLEFLQDLAKLHRSQIKIPIIGLTGSNGKTTTKELIHAVLSQKFNVQYTKGNLNNHIGVPLTLLSIKTEHDMAVIEMGANHQKEIAFLSELAQPDLGYITNFGKAHLEGFGGYEGVIKGKSELYDYLINQQKTIIVNNDDSIQNEKTQNYSHKITFGEESADYIFKSFNKDQKVGLQYREMSALSQLTGDYNFTNICAAVTLGLHFGVEISDIKKAVENYEPTNMRSQVVQKNGKTLVLDTYNANPSSMAASLSNFKDFGGSKTIIIGDMLELGDESESEHQAILNLASTYRYDQIITVGPIFFKANRNHQAFENTDALIDYLKKNKISSDNILLKASRGIALEKAAEFI
ncbi:UDP-N-acetylmuramoyl-tripeptide--D-alanyl-D-alanine ligase [Chryseobacterium sp. Leaf180]|uniref:UDP-N-acetylmuramoyl-tripeptide--D-alanyl-D- alanine ligase n=1 Tax=Chryseobacterium sp. Leaf180 TaxID=1736289 RepID=UPI0006F63E0A|nr:UDP-N-acetylmuramoyl-tripeptide--D-alanyl-D-alanine ligase [Chryseobacterium sp. Leaf180]KQR93442.1 UDP-N-acetylmuramoyl-tripeptide--D-alanyl-D-alanine ligase [Chryseobacterium sp. Leaf180]